MPRNRIVHTASFEERCQQLARVKLMAAAMLPLGPERDSLELEAKELENATKIEGWLMSSELQPPT